jgi:hypothetical protein
MKQIWFLFIFAYQTQILSAQAKDEQMKYDQEQKKFTELNKLTLYGKPFLDVLNNPNQFLSHIEGDESSRLAQILNDIIQQISIDYEEGHNEDVIVDIIYELSNLINNSEIKKILSNEDFELINQNLNNFEKDIFKELYQIKIVQLKNKSFFEAWNNAESNSDRGRFILYVIVDVIQNKNKNSKLIDELNKFIKLNAEKRLLSGYSLGVIKEKIKQLEN